MLPQQTLRLKTVHSKTTAQVAAMAAPEILEGAVAAAA
jgi:hypothetical protein